MTRRADDIDSPGPPEGTSLEWASIAAKCASGLSSRPTAISGFTLRLPEYTPEAV